MKLKKIENAVVHCGTKEEAEELIKNVITRDFLPEYLIDRFVYYGDSICYRVAEGVVDDYGRIGYYKKSGYEITEFCDLIEQEEIPKLTAEEVVEWLGNHYGDEEVMNEIFGKDYSLYRLCRKFTRRGVVEMISRWKSEHEKKEPEIEWVYRVFGAENYGEKYFQTEEEAIKRCEEMAKSQKTKQYARYERVCRVKAVE